MQQRAAFRIERGFLIVDWPWTTEVADAWEAAGRPAVIMSTTAASDLDWLPGSGVDRLKVVGGIGDESGIEAATQLRQLSIWTPATRPLDLTRLDKLELYEGYDRIGTGFTDLRLTYLSVQEFRGRTLDGLPLSELRYLSLMPAGRLRDISGVATATRLEYLGLGWAPVEDVAPIRALTSLRELELISLRYLTDLEFVEGMRLELLELENATRLSDLHPVRSLTALRCFGLRGRHRLADPNLAFLLDLPSMEIASIEVLPRGGDLRRDRLDELRKAYLAVHPGGPDTGPSHRMGFGRS